MFAAMPTLLLSETIWYSIFQARLERACEAYKRVKDVCDLLGWSETAYVNAYLQQFPPIVISGTNSCL